MYSTCKRIYETDNVKQRGLKALLIILVILSKYHTKDNDYKFTVHHIIYLHISY